MPSNSGQNLPSLFRKNKIVELAELFKVLKTSSRMTVFRRLSVIGYRVSCSHTGKFYTLESTPQYDQNGLWRHLGVLFSRDGTLRKTIIRLVSESVAGLFHRELEIILHLRVYNTLVDLCEDKLLAREQVTGEYLYLGPVQSRAKEQLACRLRMGTIACHEQGIKEHPLSLVIEVLLEVLHGAGCSVDVDVIVQRMSARKIMITTAEVDGILREYGVVKKKAQSLSKPSRS